VVPRAVGSASRLKEESDAYRARIVAQAQGDAQRFKSVLAEYQKAPQVTRDRMYLDTLQQIYSSVTKILVDSRQGSNLLYLPLDKIIQQGQAAGEPGGGSGPTAATVVPPATGSTAPPGPTPIDPRSRDGARTRERDSR